LELRGLAESDGSRVYGFGHLRADCRGPVIQTTV